MSKQRYETAAREGKGEREARAVVLTAQDRLPRRTDIAFPFRIDARGRTADVGYDDHVRQLIELLLFTSPGERVRRPDFGCGLLDLVFEPNSPELASALQLSIQGQLQRWLGDVIDIEFIDVESEENVLRVHLVYVIQATGTRRTDVFEGGTA